MGQPGAGIRWLSAYIIFRTPFALTLTLGYGHRPLRSRNLGRPVGPYFSPSQNPRTLMPFTRWCLRRAGRHVHSPISTCKHRDFTSHTCELTPSSDIANRRARGSKQNRGLRDRVRSARAITSRASNTQWQRGERQHRQHSGRFRSCDHRRQEGLRRLAQTHRRNLLYRFRCSGEPHCDARSAWESRVQGGAVRRRRIILSRVAAKFERAGRMPRERCVSTFGDRACFPTRSWSARRQGEEILRCLSARVAPRPERR